ncbi:MAG: hypothetical protein R3A52_11980 [Polyangiales bacterium]
MTPGTADHLRLPEGGAHPDRDGGAEHRRDHQPVARITANLSQVSDRTNEALGTQEGGRARDPATSATSRRA